MKLIKDYFIITIKRHSIVNSLEVIFLNCKITCRRRLICQQSIFRQFDKMCARVAYCVDIDKSVIIGNFEKRGWVSVGPDDDWHFYWASTTTCRNLFAVDSGITQL
jgi:hypothetical protein